MEYEYVSRMIYPGCWVDVDENSSNPLHYNGLIEYKAIDFYEIYENQSYKLKYDIDGYLINPRFSSESQVVRFNSNYNIEAKYSCWICIVRSVDSPTDICDQCREDRCERS